MGLSFGALLARVGCKTNWFNDCNVLKAAGGGYGKLPWKSNDYSTQAAAVRPVGGRILPDCTPFDPSALHVSRMSK